MGTLIITILTSVGGSAIVIGILQKLVINSLIEMQRHNNLKAIEEIKKTHLIINGLPVLNTIQAMQ